MKAEGKENDKPGMHKFVLPYGNAGGEKTFYLQIELEHSGKVTEYCCPIPGCGEKNTHADSLKRHIRVHRAEELEELAQETAGEVEECEGGHGSTGSPSKRPRIV